MNRRKSNVLAIWGALAMHSKQKQGFGKFLSHSEARPKSYSVHLTKAERRGKTLEELQLMREAKV